VVSVFDPCSSKYAPATQEAVRALAEGLGYALEELPQARETAACCGHGGLIYTTSAELYGRVRSGAAGAGDRPYLTYCVNCRDSFAAEGKPAIHLLDALFFPAQERFMRPAPDLSARRDNRRRLKNQLVKERPHMDSPDIRLEIDPALRATLNRRLIHEDNLRAVIGAAEASGKKVLDGATGHYTAHAAQGRVTFWAEYEPLGAGVYRLYDAYAHRMVIEE